MWDLATIKRKNLKKIQEHEAKKLKPFKIYWEIDLDATDARDAAQQALAIQRDAGSEAIFFTVKDEETGNKTDVDLLHVIDV